MKVRFIRRIADNSGRLGRRKKRECEIGSLVGSVRARGGRRSVAVKETGRVYLPGLLHLLAAGSSLTSRFGSRGCIL